MDTQDLILAIAAGESTEASMAFDSLVAEKIAAAIEVKREEIAKTMFAGAVVEEEVEHIDEISSSTLDSYRKKVKTNQHAKDAAKHPEGSPEHEAHMAKYSKRFSGSLKAMTHNWPKNKEARAKKVSEEYLSIEELANNLFEAVQANEILTEGWDQVDDDAHSHGSQVYNNEHHKDHARRMHHIEDQIGTRHGSEALKHIRKHTKAMIDMHNDEDKGFKGKSYDDHVKGLEHHMAAAKTASIEHKKKNIDGGKSSLHKMGIKGIGY